MKTMARIVFLTLLLSAFGCFEFLSSVNLFRADMAGAPEKPDIPLFLNNEPTGTVSNLSLLKSRFGSLEKKLPNANSADGSLPNIGRLAIYPDDEMTMVDIGKVWDGLSDYFGFPPFERSAFWVRNGCSGPGPRQSVKSGQKFVLSTTKLAPEELEKVLSSEGCWTRAEVLIANLQESRFVKANRVSYTSMEINASGNYLVNEQSRNVKDRVPPGANLAHPDFKRRIDGAVVKQRPIEAASLDKEVNLWFDRRVSEGSTDFVSPEDGDIVVLPIVANGNTRYSALSELLRRVNRPRARVQVIIDNTVR